MSDCIRALVDRMQPAAAHTALDRLRPQPKVEQLPVGNDPVLARCEGGHLPPPTWAI